MVDGSLTQLASNTYSGSSVAVKVKVYDDSGVDRFKVWIAGTEKISVTDSAISAGGVALSGDKPRFDNLKIGYDTERDQCGSVKADNDIDDAGDDVVRVEDYESTATTTAYDHAGNLVDDGTFRYVYDAPALDSRRSAKGRRAVAAR